MIFATIDQIPSKMFTTKYELANDQYAEEEQYVNAIESRRKEEDMVFQLPFTEYFGDGGGHHKMQDYDNGRLYLHSHKTRWTWGSVSARDGGWWKTTAQLPEEELIQKILLAGFTGISIDTHGYSDDAKLKTLQKVTGIDPILSSGGRYAFFDLVPKIEKMADFLNSSDAAFLRLKILNSLFPNYNVGVYEAEKSGDTSWRWCRQKCAIWLKNALNTPRKIRLHIKVKSTGPKDVTFLYMDTKNELVSETTASIDIVLKPLFNHRFYLESSGERVFAPNDSRKMYFQILEFNIEELKF